MFIACVLLGFVIAFDVCFFKFLICDVFGLAVV